MEKKEFALNGWAIRWHKDGILYVINRKPERSRDGRWRIKNDMRPIGFGGDEVFPDITQQSEAVEVELVVRIKNQ